MTARLNNKQVFMCLVLVFIAPLILGKLFLNMHWYREGATNLGDLLPAKLSYQFFDVKNPVPQQWQVLYRLPKRCSRLCQQQLFILRQTITALGKDQTRVTPVLVTHDKQQAKHYRFQDLQPNTALENKLSNYLFVIVDPLGKWVIGYPMPINKQGSIEQARRLLKDMHNLLNLSKVG